MRTPIAILLLGVSIATACATNQPAVRDRTQPGYGVQRTMTLFQNSRPKRPMHVRVLFYGDALVAQDWWKQVTFDLKTRFEAPLDARNYAIPGFTAKQLLRSAEHDVFPFYPDLVIFHANGEPKDVEALVKAIRSRTTAEVLLLTDEKVGDGDILATLRSLAAKYNCGICDIRGKDLGSAVRAHLVYRAELADTVDKDSVREINVRYHGQVPFCLSLESFFINAAYTVFISPKEFMNRDLRVTFTGNRVDILPITYEDSITPGSVTIDRRKPSQWTETLFLTRPQPGPGSAIFLSRVDHEAPLENRISKKPWYRRSAIVTNDLGEVVEQWTLKVIEVGQEGKTWRFSVRSSTAGDEGQGASDQPFVSPSKRVRITPTDWVRNAKLPLNVGQEIKWSATGVFSDYYSPRGPIELLWESDNDCATTMIQGLPNGKHTLEVKASWTACGARSYRIYKPPFSDDQ